LGGGWDVAVLTDRGLESAALFRAIRRLGWHPLMRVKAAGTFRPAGARRAVPMGRLVRPGGRFRAAGLAYGRRLPCTLLASWDRGRAEPWLVLTDLAPPAGEPGWYALRAWIEQGFKCLKSAGWQWQRTRMTDPARVARHWAALAVATVWAMEVGGAAEAAGSGPLPVLPRPRGRRWCRTFRAGLVLILTGLLGGRLPTGCFLPQPWPEPLHDQPPTSQAPDCQKTYPC
jgi:hypothetical protein